MEMKKYSQLVLWSIFSVLMIQSLSATEVLSAEFTPTKEQTESDKRIIANTLKDNIKLDTPSSEVYRIIKNSPDYTKMNPKLKEWVEKNKDNFIQISDGYFILYRGVDKGAEINVAISEKDKKDMSFHFNRTNFKDAEDAAWTYTQTKAINPKTKKPWFPFEKEDVKKIEKETKQKFSKEDASYIIDLLSILNENFHFYYVEEFVSLKGKVKDKSTLMGKYQPVKMLAYGAFEDFLPPESEQKRELSKKLGRAVYQLSKLIDNSKMLDKTRNCSNKGSVYVYFKDGQHFNLTYWNQVDEKEIEIPLFERAAQVWTAGYNLKNLSSNLEKLMIEKGVNIGNPEQNKTPLQQALYLINMKAQNYFQAIIIDEYVVESDGTRSGAHDFGKYKKLSDVVSLPTKLKLPHEMSSENISRASIINENMCKPLQKTR